ncbi:WXG100 family type VII secretion target [Streptomyces sp. TLI_146]|uniref:WXG100 family type VII secretion target n=1 Tax=Streptomyces sp. TLI_146 TaxID=1938858 RepID=UPI000C71220F|nr:WXG100 family type VII secretion target [Streptomyces sp. TLI_146]PKV88294.1 WXG100 family type VII secretion target [Streptomyces sp. TLI_146]
MGDLGPDLKIRYENVQEIANSIRAISKRIMDDLSRMESAVNVVASTWDGEAHGQYLKVQKDYRRDAHDIQQTLEKIAKTIEHGKASYHQTDVKASRLFTEAY